MDRQNGKITLKARYVFPVAGPPIADGSVTIEGERIVAVGRDQDGDVRDLGNVAILPGLVNAHTHLDFSDLPKPLGTPGIDFAVWIRRIMAHRREAIRGDDHPVVLGLRESRRLGVTTIGDIAQPDWPAGEIAASPLRFTIFQELIAPTLDRVADAVALGRSHIDQSDENWRPALSPHAPFSVHDELLASVVAMSAANRIPLAMHLAESREEIDLLQHGSGSLRRLLQDLGLWDVGACRPPVRSLDYLRRLALAHRALVIHGNFLDDAEIAFMAANAARMAVVYCPRTSQWFERGRYPLEKMLAAGVAVALGTDGRGSSPDLSLLAEMRTAAEVHPTVPLPQILRMGTIVGADVLGWGHRVGSIEPGKQADLAVLSLPDRDAADPHELLLRSTLPVASCYCRGTCE